jgi:plastocyanin
METTPKPTEAPKPKSNTWKLIAIVVVVLIVVGVAAYILTLPPATTTANVLVQDDGTCTNNDSSCLFSPASYNATVNGAAVVWKNNGKVLHTITSNSTANGSLPTFNNNIAQNGGTYSFTFTQAGTYYYYCNIHLWMKGVIIAK